MEGDGPGGDGGRSVLPQEGESRVFCQDLLSSLITEAEYLLELRAGIK